MKIKDLGKRYGVDTSAFGTWIKTTDFKYKSGAMGGMDIDDSQDIGAMIVAFNAFQAEENARLAELEAQQREQSAQEQAAAELAAQQKQQALASMLITSGFGFDGFTITKYSGYISGDDAISMDRPTHGYWGGVKGNVGSDLLNSLVHIRRNALAELKEAAFALGCNAVIGVDFDYLTLDPETVNNKGGTLYLPFLFAVTANGNAVVIEKHKTTGLS